MQPSDMKVGSLIVAIRCENWEPISDYEMDKFIISPDDKIIKNEVNGMTYITHCQMEFEFYDILS